MGLRTSRGGWLRRVVWPRSRSRLPCKNTDPHFHPLSATTFSALLRVSKLNAMASDDRARIRPGLLMGILSFLLVHASVLLQALRLLWSGQSMLRSLALVGYKVRKTRCNLAWITLSSFHTVQ